MCSPVVGFLRHQWSRGQSPCALGSACGSDCTLLCPQVPENPPDYQKYYRQMCKVPGRAAQEAACHARVLPSGRAPPGPPHAPP